MKTKEDNYDITLNEIAWLRKPMEKILKKIQKYDFITPNLLTTLSFVFALIAAILFLLPGDSRLAFGAALIIISYLLDCADGRLARLKKMESSFGFWFDRITDQIKLSLLILCLGMRAYFIDFASISILIFSAFVVVIQLVKEFNWALFEIFLLKNKPKTDYGKFILDNINIKFTKQTLIKRVSFHIVRILAFLHYEQIFVLSIFPCIIKPEATIYIYGILSLISLIGRISIYAKLLLKNNA